jgi:hypothetical protein
VNATRCVRIFQKNKKQKTGALESFFKKKQNKTGALDAAAPLRSAVTLFD